MPHSTEYIRGVKAAATCLDQYWEQWYGNEQSAGDLLRERLLKQRIPRKQSHTIASVACTLEWEDDMIGVTIYNAKHQIEDAFLVDAKLLEQLTGIGQLPRQRAQQHRILILTRVCTPIKGIK